MQWKASWIWNSNENPAEKNQWVCFRKTFNVENEPNAIVRITADSRYVLYVNGEECNSGPARCWPELQSFDAVDVSKHLKKGKNVLCVLVNYYGESTSQYINGRGGLLAQIEFTNRKIIPTDETWRCCVHSGFLRKLYRINVAQPWLELYDAGNFPDDWVNLGFNDSSWASAVVIGKAGCEPWSDLKERGVPLFATKNYYANCVLSYDDVIQQGFHACVNVRDNFFPHSTDSIDKAFLGYLAVILNCEKECKGSIELICRKTPETQERMKLNGKALYYPSGTNAVTVELEQGRNFLLIDISGFHQRFGMNYYFHFENNVTLIAPWESETPFVTIGPFQKENLLNIVAVDTKLNYENPDYQAVWELGTRDKIDSMRDWIKPVDSDHYLTSNPHITTITDQVACSYSVLPELSNLIVPNCSDALIQPNGFDKRIVVDFGKEICGQFVFDITACKNVQLDVDFSECFSNGRFELSSDLNSGFRYVTREGRQEYKSYLRRGFRYAIISIRNLQSPMRFHLVYCSVQEYPVAKQGEFICSDWELNQIWEIATRSVFLCMEDTYTDCPAYEQAYWIGDGRIEALVNYYAFGAYKLSKNSFKTVIPSLKRSILPEAQVPTGCNTIIPLWSILWMVSCLEYHTYSADKTGAEELFHAVRITLDRLQKHINTAGLLELTGWNMFDWAGMDTPVAGVITHQNLFLVKVLRDTAELATRLGRKEEAKVLVYRARCLQASINASLWDESRGAFIDSIHADKSRSKTFSVQTNFLAFLCDCVPKGRKERLKEILLSPPADFVQIGSPFAAFFYYEALEKASEASKIIEDIRDRWGEMLSSGATSCWETFRGFEKDRITRSHCHGWSSAPGYFLPRLILGVKPIEPGFRKFTVTPQDCGLSWARGRVPTPYGPITVSWDKRSGKIQSSVHAPKECVCVVEQE